MTRLKNIFLTGPRRAGKTTVLFRALKHIVVPYGGYVVKTTYRCCERKGHIIVDLITRDRAVLSSIRDGRAHPYIEALNGLGSLAIARAMMHASLVVMDELGRFEIGSPKFRSYVDLALDSATPVVGVIKDESNQFLDTLLSRSDIKIIRLESGCRQRVLRELMESLRPLGIVADAFFSRTQV